MATLNKVENSPIKIPQSLANTIEQVISKENKVRNSLASVSQLTSVKLEFKIDNKIKATCCWEPDNFSYSIKEIKYKGDEYTKLKSSNRKMKKLKYVSECLGTLIGTAIGNYEKTKK